MAISLKRVVIYIDGNNFYFSIKKTFNCKVDINKFCRKLTGNDNLVKINYYISPVEQFSNPKMYAEQQSFFEILRKFDKFNIVFGRLEKRKQDGKIFYVEKATDINLALDMVIDALDNAYDKAYLISNDGDFSTTISAAINRFKKEVIYIAIGNKKSISHHLKKVASQTLNIDKKFIDEVKL